MVCGGGGEAGVPTVSMSSSQLIRLARVVAVFADVPPESPIAAIATADGGADRLTYGDLAALWGELVERGGWRDRLSRIATWHSRESGPAGTVGDYCNECSHVWPCDTRRMADGTYTDDEGTPQ